MFIFLFHLLQPFFKRVSDFFLVNLLNNHTAGKRWVNVNQVPLIPFFFHVSTGEIHSHELSKFPEVRHCFQGFIVVRHTSFYTVVNLIVFTVTQNPCVRVMLSNIACPSTCWGNKECILLACYFFYFL